MNLAIFDLDNTLLDGDSDHAWGEFLVQKKLVDPVSFRKQNDQFYQDYKDGNLDIFAYQAFAIAPLTQFSLSELASLHESFLNELIKPMITEKSKRLLKDHREKGDFLLIVTATNDFVTNPIAKFLGVDDIIATSAEIANGRYTGNIVGTPSFHEGKIERLKEWVDNHPSSFDESYFYSDSINDLPLLEWVDYPCVVNADDKLKAIAAERNWPAMNLQHDS